MRTLVVAPHADDEILGVGGTMLRRKSEGGEIFWLIVSSPSEASGWGKAVVDKRKDEISQVSSLLDVSGKYELGFEPARLDAVPIAELAKKISDVFSDVKPDEVFLPHEKDVHTDHEVVFRAGASCTKWFRQPSIKRVLTYETLSETDFGIGSDYPFRPNYYVDIAEFLERKLQAMAIYSSEIAPLPFPRSIEALRSLAILRGATSGFMAAEAFQLLRELY